MLYRIAAALALVGLAMPAGAQTTCPEFCANDGEKCFLDPTCSDESSPFYNGGLGCNAGGKGQDCRFCGFQADGNAEPYMDCPKYDCPDVCTGNQIETCYYDPACSDPSSIDYVGGLGCNAAGLDQNCRFCGFTNPGGVTFPDCPPLCPDVCAGPDEFCFYDPTCSDPGAGWEGGLGCNAGGRAQECRFCGFTDGGGNVFIDCPVCDLNALAGDPAYSCGDRISWLEGIGITPTYAADAVAAEYPTICGACKASQFPSPAPGCDEYALAGQFSCRARIDWLMSPHGPGGGLSAAAAGALVESEFPNTCQGCRYWYLTAAAMWAMGAAAVVLVGTGGLVARRVRAKRAEARLRENSAASVVSVDMAKVEQDKVDAVVDTSEAL